MTARLAAVGPEVPDVDGVVAVGVAAANAVLRVGRVLEPRSRAAWVVDAEEQRPLAPIGESADEGVVGVRDERRGAVEGRHGVPPALGDVLELAVAVELVSEEVAEAYGAGPHAAHHLREHELVDLEQPEIGTVRCEERRGDARCQVRARVVPRQSPRRGEDRARHRRRRRLAVRRRDERHALGEPRRETVERAGIELPDELSRKSRAPASARGTREPADEPCRSGLEREPCSHAREGSGNVPFCSLCRISKML